MTTSDAFESMATARSDVVVLAEALRRHRRAAGISQERLAERSGVSVRTIRNIESGRVTAPRATSAWAIAAALGIDPTEQARFRALAVGAPTDRPASAAQDPDGTGETVLVLDGVAIGLGDLEVGPGTPVVVICRSVHRLLTS